MPNDNYSFFTKNIQGTINEDTGVVMAWQRNNYRNHIEFKINEYADEFNALADKKAKKNWLAQLAESKFDEATKSNSLSASSDLDQTNKRRRALERRRTRLKRLKPATEEVYKELFVALMDQLKGNETSQFWDKMSDGQVVLFDSLGNPDSIYKNYQEALNSNYNMILKGVDSGFLKFNNEQLKILNLERFIVEKSFRDFLSDYDFDYELLTKDNDIDYILDNPTVIHCWDEATMKGEDVVLRLIDLQNENRDHIQEFRFTIDDNFISEVLFALRYYMNTYTLDRVKQAVRDKNPSILTESMTNEELAIEMEKCGISEEFNNFCYVAGSRKLDLKDVLNDYQRLNLKLHPEFSLDKLHKKEQDISNNDQNGENPVEAI